MKHLKRIKPLMEALEELWQRYPELRLSQLMSNAARANGWDNHDLFYLTDGDLLKAIKTYPAHVAVARLEVPL